MVRYRNKITYLSFVLSFLIIVRHTVNLEVYGITDGFIYYFQKFVTEITDLMVPMFFALSGYLFFQDFEYSKLKDKWKRRIFSILIPYLIWNLVAYLYYQAIAIIPFIRESMNQALEPFNLKYLILNTLFDVSKHQVTWFLQNLIVYILAVPLFFKLLKKKYFAIGMMVLLFVLAIFERKFFNNAAYGFTYNAVFYIFGAFMGIHFKDAVQKRYGKVAVFGALAFILLTVTVCTVFKLNTIVRIPVRLLHIVAMWLAADLLALEKKPAWWINLSFFIYCTHSMILESFEKVMLIALGKNELGATISFLVSPAVTFGVIILGAWILKRIKPVWKLLTGNRGA